MLRISQYLRAVAGHSPAPRVAKPGSTRAPVVIWNLLRRCNLTCKHCYATSADSEFRNELDTTEALGVIDQLHEAGVRVLILSGGEPLLRDDIFQLADYARDKGFYVALSTNGTLIDEQNIERIAAADFDYVGISIDGLEAVHDEWRQLKGSFAASMHAIDLCRARGIRVGLRTTLTQHNYPQLPALLELMRAHDVQKFYLSHLNYSGRGKRSRSADAHAQMTRDAMWQIFERAWQDVEAGRDTDFVSGNNDADAILLLQWAAERLTAAQLAALEDMLRAWGGNASGAGIANIDNIGDVHPDTYWWQHTVGNVRRQRFRDIWLDNPQPLLQQLRQHPRAVGGRCGECRWLAICNGNTRTRAWAAGDLWAEDPGCYLSDAEIGLPTATQIPCRAVS
ncbi:heme d1 biosynthesis radical SAM protein NirJ [Pseudomonas fluvialis]|uniref:Heme d1 biosynthesis radical SAM protein NirJ n=1 Tax=Pseudomonas fluvialis TaxID=1793966 RepID=A0ABQ2AUG5_9PSED|nr:heme d1 biosynthesis radical SAM protein NirJ [Pseudomonas fluvialis]OXM40320.1 heme d1 biosynthesis radical SAM protein NirJ [Pseudomonas fluvialis]GGH96105.1 heme d1 biosynthesis radical SAM protein NirJ [Pseudomonas fluvialis]